MAHYSRREFLKTGLAAGALASAGTLSLKAEPQTATDWVTLGKTNVKVTRLAFGTGSFSGQVQRDLGQEQFTRLVRYAHERGVRFFETAESYSGMHEMLGIALQGVPRDSYRLMTKVTTHDGVNPQDKIDQLRRAAKTDYFDIVLLHWQHTPTWPTDSLRWQDGISEAQAKQAVLSHGASVHGLPALRQVPETKWLDVAMIRMNHKGVRMDAEDYNTSGPGKCKRSCYTCEAGSQGRNGRNQHEAGGRGRIHQPRRPQGRHEVRFQKRGRQCRHRWLQEHGGRSTKPSRTSIWRSLSSSRT